MNDLIYQDTTGHGFLKYKPAFTAELPFSS